jgi:DNA-binding LacI/PurR family transcriptional regulator
MTQPRFLTIAEQVAEHLRVDLGSGRWRETLPGLPSLAAELGVNFKTVEVALRLLEAEGLLEGQGAGRRRRIAAAAGAARRALRVALLPGDAADRRLDYIVKLEHELARDGHAILTTPRAMSELAMDTRRITRMVEGMEADAWIVLGGSRELLEWFAARSAPTFALFGRRNGLPLAGTGPDKPPTYAAAARHLIDLGHRRIVLLARTTRRLPQPGASERAFLEALRTAGIERGAYHLPDWEETPEGFHACLAELFRLTPPTALIVDEVAFFFATQQFLARLPKRVPEDVSLICTDADPHFDWCQPGIAHIRWDSAPVIRRIVSWAANVSGGKEDLRQSVTPAEFVPGGTVGRIAPAARP